MTAPAFVSHHAGAHTSTVVTVPAPASISAGNLLVAICTSGDASTGSFKATGTTWAAGSVRTDEHVPLQWLTRTATASEPSTYTFSVTGGHTIAVDIVQLSGVSGVVDVHTFGGASDTATVTFPQIVTTSTTDAVLLAFGTYTGAVATTVPAGTTTLGHAQTSYASVQVYGFIQATPGEIDEYTATLNASNNYNALALAFISSSAPVSIYAPTAFGMGFGALPGYIIEHVPTAFGEGFGSRVGFSHSIKPIPPTEPGYGYLTRMRYASALPTITPPTVTTPGTTRLPGTVYPTITPSTPDYPVVSTPNYQTTFSIVTAPQRTTFTPPPPFRQSMRLTYIPRVSETYEKPTLIAGIPIRTPSVSFVSHSAADALGTKVTVPAPADLVAGNRLVAICECSSTTTSGTGFSAPVGWTAGSRSYPVDLSVMMQYFTKLVTVVEPTTYTFEVTGPGSHVAVAIVQVTGITSTIDVSNDSTWAGGTLTFPRTKTRYSPDAVLFAFGSYTGASATAYPTALTTLGHAHTPGNSASIGVYGLAKTSTGELDAYTITLDKSTFGTAVTLAFIAERRPWLPTLVTTSIWALRLQVVVDGKEVTFFRNVPTLVKRWTSQEPFGDATATIQFPSITSFDAIRQPVPFADSTFVGIARTFTNKGYWLVAASGEVTPFGDASFFGDPLNEVAGLAAGIDATVDGYGYIIASTTGYAYCYGTAKFAGPTSKPSILTPVAGVALTKTGKGYWMVTTNGDVYSYGDAVYHGNADVGTSHATGIARSGAGTGYVIVAANGGVFCKGDAVYHGNGIPYYVTTYVGVSTYPGVTGYALVNTLGDAYCFGDVDYEGGLNGEHLAAPASGIVLASVTTTRANGYWMVGQDGGVFSFNVPFYGSVPGGGTTSSGSLSWLTLGAPVTINAVLPTTGGALPLWEGVISDWEDAVTTASVGLSVQCTGCLFQLDWLIAKPIINPPFVGYSPYTGAPVYGWDMGHAIALGINASIYAPSIGTAFGATTVPGQPTATTTPKALTGRRSISVNLCKKVDTGITTIVMPTWGKFLSGYVQNILAQASTVAGQQWTVHLQRPRTPVIVAKNLDQLTWVVAVGARGVKTNLSQTITSAATAIYGQGTAPPVITAYGHAQGEQVAYQGVVSSWADLQYPRIWEGTPPVYPLGNKTDPATTFFPGDGKAGLAPLLAWLKQCGWPFASTDTFLVTNPTTGVNDEALVLHLQQAYGQAQNGRITKAFWEASFVKGVNSGTWHSTWYQPLWQTPRVDPFTYTPSGAIVGSNVHFAPKAAARIERFEQMGQQVSKAQGITSAYNEGQRVNASPWVGTITLTCDPEQGSRFQIVAGQNILLRYFHGRDVLFHISGVAVTFTQLSVQLTVSSIGIDTMTLAAIYARDSQAHGVARRGRPNLVNLNIASSTVTFDSESGAGLIPPTTLTAGTWVVIKVPATESGQIAAVTLVCYTEDAGKPGMWSMGVFSGPVTAEQLSAAFGPLGPLVTGKLGSNPWSEYTLYGYSTTTFTGTPPAPNSLDALGLLYAGGGPGTGQACGFYPSTPGGIPVLTGKYFDGSSWTYNSAPGYAPWLWVAFYLTKHFVGRTQLLGKGSITTHGEAATTATVSGRMLASPHTAGG